jgi:hypothetical protein
MASHNTTNNNEESPFVLKIDQCFHRITGLDNACDHNTSDSNLANKPAILQILITNPHIQGVVRAKVQKKEPESSSLNRIVT